jgi:hypothetical protein
MISSEVQRTLVKSPPELWAEISDPASLARHLGEFGEIRITRVEPEQRVEWQAGDTTGSVVIKPSGWGTKVKLTVTRELDAEATAESELQATADAPVEPRVEAAAEPLLQPNTEAGAEPEIDDRSPQPEISQPELVQAEIAPAELTQTADAEPELADEPDGEPHRGFFSRLFAWRRAARAAKPTSESDLEADAHDDGDGDDGDGGELPESPPVAAHEPYNALAVWATQSQPEELQPQTTPEDELQASGANLGDADEGAPADPDADATADVSAEIAAAQEVAAEQVTAVLTGVLDRLGAAHHRPFSRS